MKKFRQIWAIALRDLSIKHRWWKDILTLIIMLIVIFGLGEGISMMLPHSTGQSYPSLFVTGMLFYMIAIIALATGTDIVIDRKGFNKILLMAPMPRISIILGKLLYLCIAVLKNYVIFCIIMMAYFDTLTISRIILSIILMLVTAMTYLGLSYGFSGMIRTRTGAETFLSITTIITLLLSGIFYSIENIPAPIKYLIYINPGTYFTEMFRYIMIGSSSIDPVMNTMIILLMCLLFTFGGIKLFEYRLRRYGI